MLLTCEGPHILQAFACTSCIKLVCKSSEQGRRFLVDEVGGTYIVFYGPGRSAPPPPLSPSILAHLPGIYIGVAGGGVGLGVGNHFFFSIAGYRMSDGNPIVVVTRGGHGRAYAGNIFLALHVVGQEVGTIF